MSIHRARFYRDVAAASDKDGFRVTLDGRPVKTPAGAAVLLPTGALADAVAAEWRAQIDKIRPETMALTRLAHTAIDRVPRARAEIAAAIVEYGKTDLLCYRAPAPESLRALQDMRWNPLLDWARDTHGIALAAAAGVVFIAQPHASVQALERAIAAQDDFALAALQDAAARTGSAVLALALAGGRIDAGEAAALARLDEDFQAAIWGRDAEAERNALHWRDGLAETARFFRLLRSER